MMQPQKTTSNKLISIFLGFIDNISDNRISGWILDKNSARVPWLEMYLDGVLIETVQPTVVRADLNLLYGANRATGFMFRVKASELLSGARKLVVKERATGFLVRAVEGLQMNAAILIEISPELRNFELRAAKYKQHLRDNVTLLTDINNDPDLREKVDPSIGNIHIINGVKGTATELFRVYALAKSLRSLGFTPLVFDVDDIKYLNTKHLKACFFIRVSADESVLKLISRLRTEGVKIIADFDDLVFRPSLMSKIDGIRFLTEEEKKQYRIGMYGYRQMILESNYVVATTRFLGGEIAEINSNVCVIKNYPLKQVLVASQAVFQEITLTKKIDEKAFIVGYYSGTLTHQADFRVCVAALSIFIRENLSARLRIVGAFDSSEFPEMEEFGDRIDRMPLMPYEKMIEDMRQVDVVIAPLEIGNEFCESKSELKFFDAALCGIPVIASKTAVYAEVIEHGKNGFLVENVKDWLDSLRLGFSDRGYLRRCGINAKKFVEENYSESSRDNDYLTLLTKLNISAALTIREKIVKKISDNVGAKRKSVAIRKRLAVLLPDILIGSGGHRKVLLFCSEYERRGGRVDIFFLSSRSDAELRQIVQAHYFSNLTNIYAYDGIEPQCDVAVATAWPTAYEVACWESCNEKYYFVQDFEPLFNPMSTEYVRAYQSYRLGLKIITFGKWNQLKIKQELRIESQCVDFSVDRETYFPMSDVIRRNVILFYARPSQPRRLYSLGLEALSLLRPHLQNWEIVFFGEDITSLPEGFTSIGEVTRLNELCKLYSIAKLGVAFSSTNPSLMPFEMLACGLPIVDVDIGYSGSDFAGTKSITYSHPTPEKLAQAIYGLISRPAELGRMSKDATDWAARLPNDGQFSLSVLKALDIV